MRSRSLGFTMIESLMVIAIIVVLIAILLPAALAGREAARRIHCTNNLKQIGLAMHDYHDQHGTFPPGVKGCCWGTWLVFVLPYIDQESVYDSWNFAGNNRCDRTVQAGMFGYAGAANTTVTSHRVSGYACPSDPNNANLVGQGGVTSQNYVVNFGNTITSQSPYYQFAGMRLPFRGAPFSDIGAPDIDVTSQFDSMTRPGTMSFAAMTDGLSGTMVASEVLVGTGGDLRGFSWWGFAAQFSGLMPPNSSSPDVLQSSHDCGKPAFNPPCTGATGEENQRGIYFGLGLFNNPRSRHPGGVNVGMVDGSVRFIRNSVDVFVFQALASTSGSELVSGDAY